ncbi:MAG: Uma2 family endonuclease [Chloroflexi bacterium]|uniref:Uma2 family endonuclease n=1 Tax=Candidatus Chlorohelix allophototropha TaxID=3003348 RepID=A0A8T7M9A0_9CHLR|nr:Uma2 family endonuclease [Chloroflexota bacterium]WJW68658.1 Uma2 family endonuclease [Chloroflexota bacterium L227-S17]
MALRKQDQAFNLTLDYYYDTHPTREDLMGESTSQSELIRYLVDVLLWLYRAENWFVVSNLNIYNTKDHLEYPLAPDVAVFKGVQPPHSGVRSWKMLLPERPAPSMVFEVCSEETITDDIEEKPEKYARLGVKEYFAYDPHEPVLRKKYAARLYGWRYNAEREAQRIESDAQGRLWSEELESWLAADGRYLRLYDAAGNLRLTGVEAERAAKEMERWRAESERAAKEAERRRADSEQAAKEVEQAAKEAERAAKEAEQAAKEKAWARLRELGIDPETL